MKRGLLPFLVLVTAGCASVRAGPRDVGAAWLPGTWLMMSSTEDRDLTPCASGLPVSYGRDGTYSLFEESGRWSLEGDNLRETALEAHEDVIDPAEVLIGKPFESRIRWLGRNIFIKTYFDGRQEVFRRCPGRP